MANELYMVAIPIVGTYGNFNDYIKQFSKRLGTYAAIKTPAHITLVPPFHLDEQQESSLIEVVTASTAEQGKFGIDIESGFRYFEENRVVYFKVRNRPSLEDMRDLIYSAVIEYAGIKKDERPFVPHITLGYKDMTPESYDRAKRELSDIIYRGDVFTMRKYEIWKLVQGEWLTIATLHIK